MTAPSLKRATYDKTVIAAWQAQRLRHREIVRRDMPRYFIIAGCMAPLYFVSPTIPLIAAVIALIGYSLYCDTRDAHLFDCPQCGKTTLQNRRRTANFDIDGLFCPHCHYWLTSPYANGEDEETK